MLPTLFFLTLPFSLASKSHFALCLFLPLCFFSEPSGRFSFFAHSPSVCIVKAIVLGHVLDYTPILTNTILSHGFVNQLYSRNLFPSSTSWLSSSLQDISRWISGHFKLAIYNHMQSCLNKSSSLFPSSPLTLLLPFVFLMSVNISNYPMSSQWL